MFRSDDLKLVEAKDYKEMSRIAGEIVLARIKKKRDSVLGLATGSTPVGLYQYMIESYKSGSVRFKDVNTFNLDEYVGLHPSHPNSYHYFMRTELFDHVDIPHSHMHIQDGEAEDMETECVRYEELIAQTGGIDLQILGIGMNGHIGFNEPKTPFTSKTHVVQLTESTRLANQRFFDSLDAVPTHAITMGIDTIMRSREILLLISGKSKAEILSRLLRESITEDIPASILKSHPNVTLIADREALSLAKKSNALLK